MVKWCRDDEVRRYYGAFCAMAAAKKKSARDMHGMDRMTAAALDMPPGGVYSRQAGVRAEFTATAYDTSPLHLSKTLHTLHGPGVLKKMTHGRVVVDHGGGVESVFVGLGNDCGEAWARRALPSLFLLDRGRTWATLALGSIKDTHECGRRRCPMSPCLKT